MQKNLTWKLIIIIGIVGYAIYNFYPPHKTIKRGLDLQGGMHLVLEVDKSGLDPKAKKGAVGRALEIIRNRIDQWGLTEPLIQPEGENKIIVQLPGMEDRERAKKMIGKTALLEFKVVSDDREKLSQAIFNKRKTPPGYEVKEYEFTDKLKTRKIPILVKKKAELTGAHLIDAQVGFASDRFNQPEVNIEFDGEGGKKFAEITRRYVGRQLAIVLDDIVLSAPVIQTEILGGRARITGNFTPQEAKDLAIQLGAGALPAPVKIIEDRTVSQTLGKDSVQQGLRAAILGLILVILFMGIYYLLSGLIANFALCLNMIIVMGALAYFKATLTLPGIAGLILTIGMAVDANVLIFERIREELATGKRVRASIAAGYEKVFSTILDANLTTLIAAGALFTFGTGPIKGFAVTLSLGIIASMFTALVVTRTIFELIALNQRFSNLHMLHFLTKTNINFIGRRSIAFIISLILITTGIISFAYRGKNNFGIDFRGGMLLQLKFDKVVSLDNLRKSLKKVGLENSTIQQLGKDNQNILIRTKTGVSEELYRQFRKDFKGNAFKEMRAEEVGPSIGKLLKKKALWAIFWVLMGILVYISVRFELKFAIAAIAALVHDVLITVGAFALSGIIFGGRELSIPALAAILTIIGYSLNDTIVVFDRIRENLKLMKKDDYKTIINTSINNTLSRTILTSLTTLLVVVSIYLFGGIVINDFAFILLVGIIIGTYSSMFVASPVLVLWHKRKQA